MHHQGLSTVGAPKAGKIVSPHAAIAHTDELRTRGSEQTVQGLHWGQAEVLLKRIPKCALRNSGRMGEESGSFFCRNNIVERYEEAVVSKLKRPLFVASVMSGFG